MEEILYQISHRIVSFSDAGAPPTVQLGSTPDAIVANKGLVRDSRLPNNVSCHPGATGKLDMFKTTQLPRNGSSSSVPELSSTCCCGA